MKTEKPPPNVDDIELVPDAWERFKEAVKVVARHPPVRHPTDHGKQESKPKKPPANQRP
jgi:hypothetical protein